MQKRPLFPKRPIPCSRARRPAPITSPVLEWTPTSDWRERQPLFSHVSLGCSQSPLGLFVCRRRKVVGATICRRGDGSSPHIRRFASCGTSDDRRHWSLDAFTCHREFVSVLSNTSFWWDRKVRAATISPHPTAVPAGDDRPCRARFSSRGCSSPHRHRPMCADGWDGVTIARHPTKASAPDTKLVSAATNQRPDPTGKDERVLRGAAGHPRARRQPHADVQLTAPHHLQLSGDTNAAPARRGAPLITIIPPGYRLAAGQLITRIRLALTLYQPTQLPGTGTVKQLPLADRENPPRVTKAPLTISPTRPPIFPKPASLAWPPRTLMRLSCISDDY
jgi:hypothetical protein